MQLTKTPAAQIEELKNEIGILKKQLEKSRRSGEELLQLIESANSMIIRWDINGTLTFVNEYAQNFFGYTLEEMIGKSVMIIVPETETSGRDLTKLMDEIISEPGEFVHFENENIKKNGEHVWISWTNRAISDESGKTQEILAVGSDITERKKTEDTLKIEQEILQAVIGNMGTGFVVADTRGNILSMNESALLMHDFANNQEMLSRLEQYTNEFELKYPDGRNIPFDLWPLALSLKGQFIKDYEVRLLNRKNNTYKNISYNTAPVYDNDGNPILIVLTMTDLTDIYERTAALKESQQRYLSLFNNSTMGISHCLIIRGQEGEPVDYKILQVNDAFTRITGIKREDAEGKIARELLPDLKEYIGNLGKVAAEGGEFNQELFMEAFNKWISVYVYSPTKDEFTVFLSDISDRKLV
jgi:PAS domain S-box-containing protein